MQLHGTDRVVLMVHSDCGAYGGLQAFGSNKEREAVNHESELLNAAKFLKSNVSSIEVECYYLRFDGVWAVEAA
jgi:carbonic anhydrase